MDGIEWHEGEEVGMGDILKFILEFNSIVGFERPQFRKRLQALFQNALNRRTKNQGTGVVPALEYLAMDLLNLPKADQSVLQRHHVGKRLISTVVDECDGEFRNPIHTTMVIGGRKSGNIEQANTARASQAFFVARAGRFDGPSIVSFPRTIIVIIRTGWNSETHMMVNWGEGRATEGRQVDRRWIPGESPLRLYRRQLHWSWWGSVSDANVLGRATHLL